MIDKLFYALNDFEIIIATEDDGEQYLEVESVATGETVYRSKLADPGSDMDPAFLGEVVRDVLAYVGMTSIIDD